MPETGPWMPLYWADYFGDTMHLTTEEHGAYLLLIGAYWRHGGPIPADDRYLSRATRSGRRWGKIKDAVLALFTIEISDVDFGASDNRLTVPPENPDPVYQLRHKRIDLEILRSSDRLQSARANGRAGAQAKRKLTTTTTTVTDIADAISPPKSPMVDVHVKEGKSDGRKRPAKPIPADWKPDAADQRAARERGLSYAEVEIEAVKFRDYCLAHDKRYVDFAAAWRNWCDSPFRKSGAPRVNGGGAGPESLAAHRERDRRGILAALAGELDNRDAGAGVDHIAAGAGGGSADDF